MAFTQISTKGIKDGTITGTDLATNVDLADNQKIRFGAGNDLQIHHDASDSIISNTSGVFFIQNTGDLRLRVNNTEAAVHCVANGAVELYHDNTKRLETNGAGIEMIVTGKHSASI